MGTSASEASTAGLRGAAPADFPAIARLLRENDLPTDGVRDALADFVVAEHGGAIVGVAGLERCRDNGLLRSLAVAGVWRSRGLGHALVARIVEDARRAGLDALYLLTTTAEPYFPRFGFARIARDEAPDDVRGTSEFTTACPASAVVMRRALR